MTRSKPISAIVFDMDGTLHDTETVYTAATRLAVEAVGFSVTERFCHSLIGIPSREGDEMIQSYLGPAFPFDEYRRQYSELVGRALASAIPLKAGAVELLQRLAGGKLKLAVATSATRDRAELQLGRSGLLEHLPLLVTRDDVARGKPFPDLFLKAAERLHVPPAECLAVEDSLNGVRAAHAAGMMTVMVPDLVQPTDEIRAMCMHIALDLYEVGHLITRSSDAPSIQ